jgi:hypothetical protein
MPWYLCVKHRIQKGIRGTQATKPKDAKPQGENEMIG